VKLRTGAVSQPSHPFGVTILVKPMPGVARFARSPLANLLPRLRHGKRSPEGCENISPGLSEAKPGVRPQGGCDE
jgi:hypothetical protein